MKKYLVGAAITALLTSCGSGVLPNPGSQDVAALPQFNSIDDLKNSNNGTIEQNSQSFSKNLSGQLSAQGLPWPARVVPLFTPVPCTANTSSAPDGYITVQQSPSRNIAWGFFMYGANKGLYNYWQWRVTINSSKLFEDSRTYEPHSTINAVSTTPGNYVYIQGIATGPGGKYTYIQQTCQSQ